MQVFIDFEKNPILFDHPQKVIRCHDSSSLEGAFRDIEEALQKGCYVAGFLSYEAGYCFEKCLNERKAYDFPLLMMGIYEKPDCHRLLPERFKRSAPEDFALNVSKARYSADIERIRNYIAQGEVYQITYCLKWHFKFHGSPLALYSGLYRGQPVPYPAFVETDQFKILSLSPERFVKKTGRYVTTEPMKGTWPRGSNFLRDSLARLRFSRDSKNRAENVMIADLLRNDLGRIGTGIAAPRLFTVAGYRTLFQMTSTVTGEVPPDVPVYDLFAAIFPSGSVTGAPKIRAMEIIRQLETEERKIYTGAIGYIAPNRDLYFNIPIRTILLAGEAGEMGVGGGIVWDSTAEGEWAEGMLKSRFLTDFA